MKKIKFGCFPMISIKKEDRMCIDTYSIKNYADLIASTTQLANISTDTKKYITPDAILRYFKTEERQLSKMDNDISKDKVKTMRRAFTASQMFNKQLRSNPFYRDVVTHPIYVESKNENMSHDYDFILLCNDLVNNSAIDEIHYGDDLSLTLLYLKDQLYPAHKLTDIGVSSDTQDIRANIAKFIEFSKNNDATPFSAMVSLIKIAAKNKDTNHDGYRGFIHTTTSGAELGRSISDKLNKLFGGERNGQNQIVDVDFLLRTVSHRKIAEFFDDAPGENRDNPNYNSHTSISDETTQSSRIERQYLNAKVGEYNKILSLVDSLIRFNRTDDIVDAINDLQTDTLKLIARTDDENNKVTVKYDHSAVVQSIRGKYFEDFVRCLVVKTNNQLKAVLTKMKDHINSGHLTVGKMKKEYGDIARIQLNISDAERNINENRNNIKKIEEEIEKNKNTPMTQNDIYLLHSYNRNIQLNEEKITRLQMQLQFNTLGDKRGDTSDKDKVLTSDIKFNIETIQSALTDLLYNIEANISTNEQMQTFVDKMAPDGKVIPLSVFIDLLEGKQSHFLNINSSVNELAIDIVDGMREMLYENISGDNYDGASESGGSERVHKFLKEFGTNSALKQGTTKDGNGNKILDVDDDGRPIYTRHRVNFEGINNIKQVIVTSIKHCLYSMYKAAYNEHGTTHAYTAKKYADMRLENNKVIRQTLKQSKNFKTLIFSEDQLVSLYDMINYTDQQKYLAGLIAYPPSKISNPLNKIKMMIKRLGLSSNPVFIVSQSNIILSNPDYLSLIGDTHVSKISMIEMRQICKLDYNKELWDANHILKELDNTRKSEKIKDSVAELKKSAEEINRIISLHHIINDKHASIVKANSNANKSGAKKELIKKFVENEVSKMTKLGISFDFEYPSNGGVISLNTVESSAADFESFLLLLRANTFNSVQIDNIFDSIKKGLNNSYGKNYLKKRRERHDALHKNYMKSLETADEYNNMGGQQLSLSNSPAPYSNVKMNKIKHDTKGINYKQENNNNDNNKKKFKKFDSRYGNRYGN